ncbi:nucleoside phosphorylase domain-containing protein [Trichoderma evansii]
MTTESKRGDIFKIALSTVQNTSTQYEQDIDGLNDLPLEFEQVNLCFPLVRDTLRHVRGNPAWDEFSTEIIRPLAASLENKAKMLQRIFSDVGKEIEKDSNDESVLDCYRDTLVNMGKSYRVEVLMLGLLKDSDALFTKDLVKTEKYTQVDELKDAIDRISKVESSVPDADFKTNGANFNQHIASGGTGNQAYYGGRGHHVFNGNGAINNYHATAISFVSPYHDGQNGQNSHHMDGNSRNQDRNPRIGDHTVGHDQLQLRPSQAQNEGRPHGRADFQIAIICALPLEYDVVYLLFDQFWDDDGSYGRARGDMNTYTTGRMGQYDVVLALLPNMGTVAAAGAAASFRSSYPILQLAFLVGICSGVPGQGENEIHLGDVVISKSAVQYDLGNQYHQEFVIKDTVDDSLGRPNKNIRSLVASFQTEHIKEQLQQKACLYLKDLQNAAIKKRRRQNYQYPGMVNDKLFNATYRHKHRGLQPCNFCDNQIDVFCEKAAKASCAELGCDETQLVQRKNLEMRSSTGDPEIFIGRIASGNSVMKSGEHRDKIAEEQKVIALEMEGAGLWDEIPCIIVKGVSDYADSHGNVMWQCYAAATAASVLKAVLGRYTMTDR